MNNSFEQSPEPREGGLDGKKSSKSPESEKLERGVEIYDIYRKKLTEGRVSALIKTILSDPNTRTRFYQLFNDKDIFASSNLDLSDITQKATPLIVAMMRDQGLRDLFIDAVLNDTRDKSIRLGEAIREADTHFEEGPTHETEGALVYNRLIVGAGVHAAILNNKLTREDPHSKNITVDRGNNISGNFSTKSFVAVNTRNQPHTGKVPNFETKKGNLNYFGKDAPVQLSYVEPEIFPSANTIAEVATANQFLSNSEVLFASNIERICLPEDERDSDKWPAKYKVKFTDGRFVFADEIIITSGLGDIEYPKQFDTETMKIVKRDSKVSPEGVPPGVMTYEEFAEFVTDSPTPLRHFAEKTIDVAGGGDGASTVLEELLRFGKRKSYKLDVAQVGTPTKVHWVGQKIKDSTQYKSLLANERYLMLAQDMPLSHEELAKYHEQTQKELERKIDPKDGYLVQIRDSDNPSKGRYRVTYLNPETKSVSESYTDYIIIAAGYKNRIGSLFGKDHNPFDVHEEAGAVIGDINSVPAPIAVKLKDQDIYATGPASMGKVLQDSSLELASLSGLPVSKGLQYVAIAVYGPRTEKLAEILGNKKRRDIKPLTRQVDVIKLERSEDLAQKYLIEAGARKKYREDMLADVRIKTAIGYIFAKCNIESTDLGEVEIVVEKNPKDKKSALISFSPNFTNAESIVNILKSEKLADDLVNSVSGSRWRTVVNVPFDKSGRIKIPEINIRREKG